MASACEYSPDAIDSVAMKSAALAADEAASLSLPSEPPSAAGRLVEGLEEAMSIISDMLQSSSGVMETFKSEWDAALTSYQIDIGVLDEEIERAAKEQKRRNKRMQQADGGDADATSHEKTAGPEADHALNFHLRSKDGHPNDGSDVFMLPVDEAEVEITLLSDEGSQGKEINDAKHSVAPVADGKVNDEQSKQPVTKKENEERVRFNAVASLINKMQSFQEEEEDLLKQLSDAQPNDNGMTATTLQERQDLEDRLERCRSRQTQQVVASVADYKPKFKASGSNKSKLGSLSSNKHLGLNLTPIEDLLQNAVADAVPATGAKTDSKTKPGRKGTHVKRQKHACQQEKTNSKVNKGNSQERSSKVNKGNSLTLNYTNVSEAAEYVLQDPNNFLTVHELAITNPTSKRPEPVARSLSSLVSSNTRALNAMEMGRRNRVGR